MIGAQEASCSTHVLRSCWSSPRWLRRSLWPRGQPGRAAQAAEAAAWRFSLGKSARQARRSCAWARARLPSFLRPTSSTIGRRPRSSPKQHRGSQGEVSGRRHPQPHRAHARDHQLPDHADGRAEYPRAEQSERRIRRCRQAARGLHQEHAVRRPVHRVCQRPQWIQRRRAGLRTEGRRSARGRREERRHRFQDLQRNRDGHEEGGRHAVCRSPIRSSRHSGRRPDG